MHSWRPDRLIQVNFSDSSAGADLPPAAFQALLENACRLYSTTPRRPLCEPMYHSRPRASVTILRMPTLLEGSCTTRICSVFGSKRTTVSVLISFTHTI